MPHPVSRARLALALAAAAVLALACTTATNPTTGRREVVLMSPEDEQHVDEQAEQEIAQSIGTVSDPDLVAYVQQLGAQLAEHSPRRGIEYHFAILEGDEPNAFALPGGHVYVSRGLLLLANSEAELAHVLGHEIGHVAARHSAKLDAHAKTLGLATLLSNLLSGGAEETSEAENVGGHPLARYQREQERQADTIGQEIAKRAGVEPGGMARFLIALDSYTKLSQGFSMPQTYFSTHPATRERIVEATTRAQTEVLRTQSPGVAARPISAPSEADRNAYLDRIDGMNVSRPASEGVFVDDRFFHADLGFSLRFPYGWETRNEPAQVIAIAPNRDGFVLLELQGAGNDPVAAARRYAEQQQIGLERGTPVRIGELHGFRAATVVASPAGALNAEITWVAYGGRIYRLIGGMRAGQVGKYQGQYRKFAQSFRLLSPADASAIQERRLRIATAQAGETLAELSARTGNRWDVNYTAVANGIFARDTLAAGQRIKVAVDEPYAPSDAPPPAPKGEASDPDA